MQNFNAIKNYDVNFTATLDGDTVKFTGINVLIDCYDDDEELSVNVSFEHNSLGENGNVQAANLINNTHSILCYGDSDVLQACKDYIAAHVELSTIVDWIDYSEQGMQDEDYMHCDASAFSNVTYSTLVAAGFEIEES